MKRKMFRKLMSASLATMMVAGLAGCGNGNNSSSVAASGSGAVTPGSTAGSTPQETSKYTPLTDANGNVYEVGGM